MKNIATNIKKLMKTERGKSILFLGGFIIVALIIVIIINTTNNYSMYDQMNEIRNANYKRNGVNISGLTNKNYEYQYTIINDNKKIVIKGRMDGFSEVFICNDGVSDIKYYRNSDGLFKLNNKEWVKSEYATSYDKFFNLQYINLLLDKSKLFSNTEYADGSKDINLTINTNDINHLINDKITEYNEDINNVKVYDDKDNRITGIEFDLVSYCKIMKVCNNRLNIKIDISNIDRIKDIINPIKN